MKRVKYLYLVVLLTLHFNNIEAQIGRTCEDAITVKEGENNRSQKDSIWFKYVSVGEHLVTISSVNKTSINTKIDVLDKCGEQPIFTNRGYKDLDQFKLSFTTKANTTYYIKSNKEHGTMVSGEGFDWVFSKSDLKNGDNCRRPIIITKKEGQKTIPKGTRRWYSYSNNMEDKIIKISIDSVGSMFSFGNISNCDSYINMSEQNKLKKWFHVRRYDDILLALDTYNDSVNVSYSIIPPPVGSISNHSIRISENQDLEDTVRFTNEINYMIKAIKDIKCKITYTNQSISSFQILKKYYNTIVSDTAKTFEKIIVLEKGSEYNIKFKAEKGTKISWKINTVEASEGDFCDKAIEISSTNSKITILPNKNVWYKHSSDTDKLLSLTTNNVNSSFKFIRKERCENYSYRRNYESINSTWFIKSNRDVLHNFQTKDDTLVVNYLLEEAPVGCTSEKPITIDKTEDLTTKISSTKQLNYRFASDKTVKVKISYSSQDITNFKIIEHTKLNNTTSNDYRIVQTFLKSFNQVYIFSKESYYTIHFEGEKGIDVKWKTEVSDIPIGEDYTNPKIAVLGENISGLRELNKEWYKYTPSKTSKLNIEVINDNSDVKISTYNFGKYRDIKNYALSYDSTNLTKYVLKGFPIIFKLSDNDTNNIKFIISEKDLILGDTENNPKQLLTNSDTNFVNNSKEYTWFKYQASKNLKLRLSFDSEYNQIIIIKNRDRNYYTSQGSTDSIYIQKGEDILFTVKNNSGILSKFTVKEIDQIIGDTPNNPITIEEVTDLEINISENKKKWYKFRTTKHSHLQINIKSDKKFSYEILKGLLGNRFSTDSYVKTVNTKNETKKGNDIYISIESNDGESKVKLSLKEHNELGATENNPIILNKIEDTTHYSLEYSNSFYSFTPKENGNLTINTKEYINYILKEKLDDNDATNNFYTSYYGGISLVKGKTIILQVYSWQNSRESFVCNIIYRNGFSSETPLLAKNGINISDHTKNGLTQNYIYTMPKTGVVTVSTCGITEYNTRVIILKNKRLQTIGNNECGKQSKVLFYGEKGETFQIKWEAINKTSYYKWNLTIEDGLPQLGDNCTNAIEANEGENSIDFTGNSIKYYRYKALKNEKITISSKNRLSIDIYTNCQRESGLLGETKANKNREIYLKKDHELLIMVYNINSIRNKSFNLKSIETDSINNMEYIYSTEIKENTQYIETYNGYKNYKYYTFTTTDNIYLKSRTKNLIFSLFDEDFNYLAYSRYLKDEYIEIAKGKKITIQVKAYGPSNNWKIITRKKSDADFIKFGFSSNANEVTIKDSEIDIKLSSSKNIKLLIPIFEVSRGATVKLNDEIQKSNKNAVDFSSAVEYTIEAKDGTKKVWKINVTQVGEKSSEADIKNLTFGFNNEELLVRNDTVIIGVPLLADVGKFKDISYELSDFARLIYEDKPLTKLQLDRSYKAVCMAEDGTVKIWTIVTKTKRDNDKGLTYKNSRDLDLTTTNHSEGFKIWYSYTATEDGYLSMRGYANSLDMVVYEKEENINNNNYKSYSVYTYKEKLIPIKKGDKYFFKVSTYDWYGIHFDAKFITESKENNLEYFNINITYEEIEKIDINKTINIVVSHNTDLTKIKSTFRVSSLAKVYIGEVEQESDYTENNFSGVVKYTIKADNGDAVDWTVTTTKRAVETGSSILSFNIEGQLDTTAFDLDKNYVTIHLDSKSDSIFKPQFTLSPKAKAFIMDKEQFSGESEIKYNDVIKYKIVAENDSVKEWTLHLIKTDAKKESKITAFSIVGQTADAIIDEPNKKITISLIDTVLTKAIIATFVLSESSTATIKGIPQVSGVTVTDFSTAVEYVVTAQDGTSSKWTVEVTGGMAEGKNDLKSFKFLGQTAINIVFAPGSKLVIVTLDKTVDQTKLIAEFELSPYAKAKIDGKELVSKITQLDYTGSKTLEITSLTGQVSNWTITISTSNETKKVDLDAKLYPIPSDGEINLEINDPSVSEVRFEVYDMTGRRHFMKSYTNPNSGGQIDLKFLPDGMYIGYIKTDIDNKTVKIIIKK